MGFGGERRGGVGRFAGAIQRDCRSQRIPSILKFDGSSGDGSVGRGGSNGGRQRNGLAGGGGRWGSRKSYCCCSGGGDLGDNAGRGVVAASRSLFMIGLLEGAGSHNRASTWVAHCNIHVARGIDRQAARVHTAATAAAKLRGEEQLGAGRIQFRDEDRRAGVRLHIAHPGEAAFCRARHVNIAVAVQLDGANRPIYCVSVAGGVAEVGCPLDGSAGGIQFGDEGCAVATTSAVIAGSLIRTRGYRKVTGNGSA